MTSGSPRPASGISPTRPASPGVAGAPATPSPPSTGRSTPRTGRRSGAGSTHRGRTRAAGHLSARRRLGAGDIDSHDQVCRIVAASLVRWSSRPTTAGHRSSLSHPLLDAVAAARWAGRAFPGREHVLAGDSAGASLAIGVALDARDSGELRFAAQLLLYPPVDPRLLFAAAGEHAEGYLLSVDDMAYHYDLYVPDLERRLDPAIDLLSADLRHLPPTVVATAEFDPLHDEGVELADKLAVAGVPVRHVRGRVWCTATSD
ncbi:alpha/beta hydrolase, partial [Streptomyces sp. LBUM 1478]|nr:alpha/beta hydrolase [Streptomyces sp. LBUM 1478]